MVPFSCKDPGQQLPTGGTARGDECDVCGRRFTKMLYMGGRRQCLKCTEWTLNGGNFASGR